MPEEKHYPVYELYERELDNVAGIQACVDVYTSRGDTEREGRFVGDTRKDLAIELIRANVVILERDVLTTIPAPRLVLAKEGTPMVEPASREFPVTLPEIDSFYSTYCDLVMGES